MNSHNSCAPQFQDVVAERVDRLESGVQVVLKVAAVMGPEVGFIVL